MASFLPVKLGFAIFKILKIIATYSIKITWNAWLLYIYNHKIFTLRRKIRNVYTSACTYAV